MLWIRALALALFAVVTNFSQDWRSRPTSSIHNFIEGRVGLLSGNSQRQTPIELTGVALDGQPNLGLLPVSTGSPLSFDCRRF